MLPVSRAHTATPACAVCAAPVRWPQSAAAGAAVCSAAPCRLVMSQQPTMHPVAFQSYLAFHVGNVRAQQAAFAENARRVRLRARQEADENAQHWALLQAQAGADARATVTRLVLPSGPRREQPLSQRRRRAYRAHLNRIVREARAAAALEAAPPAAASVDPVDPHARLRARLCAACAGGCCTRGGDSAYLTAATMQRVMAAQPGLGPRALVAAYMDRLGNDSLHGSCINHTPGGCVLPRELRSDTCNRYLCEAQKELSALAAGADSPPVLALVIVRRQDQWTKGDPSQPNEVIGSACISATSARPLGA